MTPPSEICEFCAKSPLQHPLMGAHDEAYYCPHSETFTSRNADGTWTSRKMDQASFNNALRTAALIVYATAGRIVLDSLAVEPPQESR